MSVRVAGEAEYAAVAELTALAYDEFAAQSDPSFWDDYVEHIRATLNDPTTGVRLVLDVDGQLAASVLYVAPREDNPHPEFRLLAVHPEHRDLRLGGQLIDACEQRARDEGFDAITLHTTVLMQTAKAMYERRGYVPAPELDFRPTPDFLVWGYRKAL